MKLLKLELRELLDDIREDEKSLRKGIQYHNDRLPEAQERVANAVLELTEAINDLISIKRNIALAQGLLAKNHRKEAAAKELLKELDNS